MINKPALYIAIGPPACGKSTLANKMIKAGMITASAVVATDMFRYVMTGSRTNQDANKSVFEVCDLIARERLAHGLPVYLDSTGRAIEFTRNLANFCKESGGDVYTIRFNVTAEECRKRNNERENPVPEVAMEGFIDYFLYNPDGPVTFGTVVWSDDLIGET